MNDIPLDDRGLAIEKVFEKARGVVASAGVENIDAFCFLSVRRDPIANACDFAGRPTVALLAVVELLVDILRRIEPDKEKRLVLLDTPFFEVLQLLAARADSEASS